MLELIVEYINAALDGAKYGMLEEEDAFYAEVPGLKGVWANGKTLEECRRNLAEVIEGWIIIRIKKDPKIPQFGDYFIDPPKEMAVVE